MPLALGSDAKANLVATLGTLFKELTLAGDSVPPIAFLQVCFACHALNKVFLQKKTLQMFRTVYPQFAERDASGFMQQDAEEAWGQIIQVLTEKVPGLGADNELLTSKRFVEQFMTVDTIST